MNEKIQDLVAWRRWGTVLVMLSTLSLLAGGYLLDLAAPQTPNLLDKRWDAPVRLGWDMELARLGGGLLAASAATAAIGLMVRAVLGGGAGHDARARAHMAIGTVAALAVAWVTFRGPLA